jgi:hypothetical protein
MWVKLIFIGIIISTITLMELSQTAKHKLVKGMDDVLFEEMFNDFQEHDNIPLACNSNLV